MHRLVLMDGKVPSPQSISVIPINPL